jgi:hypothetical protein
MSKRVLFWLLFFIQINSSHASSHDVRGLFEEIAFPENQEFLMKQARLRTQYLFPLGREMEIEREKISVMERRENQEKSRLLIAVKRLGSCIDPLTKKYKFPKSEMKLKHLLSDLNACKSVLEAENHLNPLKRLRQCTKNKCSTFKFLCRQIPEDKMKELAEHIHSKSSLYHRFEVLTSDDNQIGFERLSTEKAKQIHQEAKQLIGFASYEVAKLAGFSNTTEPILSDVVEGCPACARPGWSGVTFKR